MQAKELKPITLEEFETMEKEERFNYELIDGIVMMSPRPSKNHQFISGNIYFELRNVLKDKNCGPLMEIEVVLENNNLVPDISIICDDDNPTGKRHEKPPLIVIEVISPSSASRDHIIKRLKYESLGIKEYWIVSPEEKCITVINFVDETTEMYCHGEVKSLALLDITIDLANIFT